MAADDILLDSEERMEKAVDVFKHALGGIRTGRANPGLVDSLRVEVYGSQSPLKAIAQVGAPEPTQIVIRPFRHVRLLEDPMQLDPECHRVPSRFDGRL